MDGHAADIDAWRKSSFSQDSCDCVEVAQTAERFVAVRDSKDTGGPRLVFGAAAWAEFVQQIRSNSLG